MKNSIFNPYNFLIIALCATFLVSAGNDNEKHLGGKAVKADLVAIFSQLKKVAESRSFQNDLAQLVKKHVAKIDLNKEQFKDLKEFLTIFDQFAKIDQQQLMLEHQEYFQKRAEERSRLLKAEEAGDISEQELIEFFQSPKESMEKEKGPLMVEWENLTLQLNDKFIDSDLVDALKEVFSDQYDMGLMSVFSAVGSDAAQVAIKTIDGKLDYKKKMKKSKEA